MQELTNFADMLRAAAGQKNALAGSIICKNLVKALLEPLEKVKPFVCKLSISLSYFVKYINKQIKSFKHLHFSSCLALAQTMSAG